MRQMLLRRISEIAVPLLLVAGLLHAGYWAGTEAESSGCGLIAVAFGDLIKIF